MGKNIYGEFEKDFACGPQGRQAGRRKTEEEAYLAGKNLGYNLGYNFGFDSGFEKGYAEGSNLGYNNGFVSALRQGEGGHPVISGKNSEIRICQALKKLSDAGMTKIFISGCAAKEAESLLKYLGIEVTVVNAGIKS